MSVSASSSSSFSIVSALRLQLDDLRARRQRAVEQVAELDRVISSAELGLQAQLAKEQAAAAAAAERSYASGGGLFNATGNFPSLSDVKGKIVHLITQDWERIDDYMYKHRANPKAEWVNFHLPKLSLECQSLVRSALSSLVDGKSQMDIQQLQSAAELPAIQARVQKYAKFHFSRIELKWESYLVPVDAQWRSELKIMLVKFAMALCQALVYAQLRNPRLEFVESTNVQHYTRSDGSAKPAALKESSHARVDMHRIQCLPLMYEGSCFEKGKAVLLA